MNLWSNFWKSFMRSGRIKAMATQILFIIRARHCGKIEVDNESEEEV